ncbi:Transcription factor bHLH30 [Heracleum sosnowskyi]|uniref:Transcription factor bHLH30 n=1 Tax=Heracleum sosnowskyi TaxID=360622 RepID=A0AAD8IQ28_9APIA|nr:Transcription factor bHLH30 [Heracleum sosnowskyi]
MEYSNSVDGYKGIVSGGGSSLILDNERGEIVRAVANNCKAVVNKASVDPEKAMVALRNHSQAERRRRERINAHLSTFRNIIPGTTKMDKASLLAEVIDHLKQLRRNAADATKGILVPMDIDEVRVEQQDDGLGGDSCSIRASICCEYKHEVLSDLRQALEALHPKTVRAEIATLGSRMVNLFVITGCKQENIQDAEGCQLLLNSVRQTLRSVLDKFHASEDFTQSSALSNKRRRVSLFNSSNESSLGSFW